MNAASVQRIARHSRLYAGRIVSGARGPVGAVLAFGWSLAFAAHATPSLPESCPVAAYPGAQWQSVEPAPADWSREKLIAAREYSASIHSSSVMLVEHGVVIEEWGDVAKKISS